MSTNRRLMIQMTKRRRLGWLASDSILAEHTLSPEGPKLWKALFHKSACLSCSWGTGGHKGGFTGSSVKRDKRQDCVDVKEKPATERKVEYRTLMN
jgi:hypothetical protein